MRHQLATPTLLAVIAFAVKARRKAMGLTQSEFAEIMRGYLLHSWNRDTVSATEAGRRMPSIEETVVLAAALECSVIDLFSGPANADVWVGTPTEKDIDASWNLGHIRTVIAGGPNFDDVIDHRSMATSLTQKEIATIAAEEWVENPERFPGPVDYHIAEKIGCGVHELCWVACGQYGHSLTRERDRRLDEISKAGATPARIGALKGHITRKLFEEIVPVVRHRQLNERLSLECDLELVKLVEVSMSLWGKDPADETEKRSLVDGAQKAYESVVNDLRAAIDPMREEEDQS